MALTPLWGFDPWAARPSAVILTRRTPLAAETTLRFVGSNATAKSASSPPLHRNSAPRLPCSSPAVATTLHLTFVSRRSRDRDHSASAEKRAAVGPFVSHAPRPYRRPSLAETRNAGTVIPSTPTVSMWGAKTTVFFALLIVSNTARTLGRPRPRLRISTSAPNPSRYSATQAAIRASPGLVPPESASGCTLGSETSSERMLLGSLGFTAVPRGYAWSRARRPDILAPSGNHGRTAPKLVLKHARLLRFPVQIGKPQARDHLADGGRRVVRPEDPDVLVAIIVVSHPVPELARHALAPVQPVLPAHDRIGQVYLVDHHALLRGLGLDHP